MKYIGPASLVLLSASSALAAGTVEFSLGREARSQILDVVERDLDGTSESALLTNFAGTIGHRYLVNITVGTPPQPQTLIIDTGSSDTILIASDASPCTKEKLKLNKRKHHHHDTPEVEHDSKCIGGSFNTSASSTFQMLSAGAINASYGVNATAANDVGGYVADLVTDVVQIGKLVVSGTHLGLAHEASGNFIGNGFVTGIMGLSYAVLEATGQSQPKYPTFVESLVGAKAIASRLYSIYLNELSSYGSLLFGGVDTEKYTGNLTTLNFLPSTVEGVRQVQWFALRMEQVSVTHEDGTEETIVEPNEFQGAVWPDTGTSTWVVPSDTYNKIVNMTGATMTGSNALTPCSKISNNTSLTFTLSGNGTNKAQLEVPLTSFFIPATLTDGSIAKLQGEVACMLMVQEAAPDSTIFLMGDPVMRAGYWVFDLDNGQVSIAQARLSSTTSNIVTIEAGPQGIMNATHQPSGLGANSTAKIDGMATASVTYSLSTAASAVGQTTGPQSTTLSGGAVGLMLDQAAGRSMAAALLLSVMFGAFLL